MKFMGNIKKKADDELTDQTIFDDICPELTLEDNETEVTQNPEIVATNQSSIVYRTISLVRDFFDDWQKRKELAARDYIYKKPQNAYRDAPELNINNISTDELKKRGLEKIFISSNRSLHELFSDFLSVLTLKIGNAESYNLSQKYKQITGLGLAFDFSCLKSILADLIESEYFLKNHKYLLEIDQYSSKSSDADNLNPESLLGKLVEIADRKAGKYIFRPSVPNGRYLSKMDLDNDLLYEHSESAIVISGFNPEHHQMRLLPLACILANPTQFSRNIGSWWLVDVFVAARQNDSSFLASVSNNCVQLAENCYFGNRKHYIAGRSHCSKSHQLGQVRLMLEEK